MEIFIYYRGMLNRAHDEVEDALTEDLVRLSCEVTGAGAGEMGGNFDLRVSNNLSEKDAVLEVAQALRRIGFSDDVIIQSENLRTTVGKIIE